MEDFGLSKYKISMESENPSEMLKNGIESIMSEKNALKSQILAKYKEEKIKTTQMLEKIL